MTIHFQVKYNIGIYFSIFYSISLQTKQEYNIIYFTITTQYHNRVCLHVKKSRLIKHSLCESVMFLTN